MKLRNLLVTMLAVCFFGTATVAQNATTTDQNQRHDRSSHVGKDASVANSMNVRVSKLMGMNIQNSQQENVGEINDLVIDARNGNIRFVAVTYGGFLGIGDDLHAVPFEAMKLTADPDDRDSLLIVLNVTKEQMKNAKGFNESTWPNFADSNFTDSINDRYGVNRKRSSVQQDKSDTRGASRAGNLDSKTVGHNIRASNLIGMNIQNNEQKGVGEINDLVVDAKSGKINYLAVTYGGFLGIGNDMHAVPFNALKFKADPNDKDDTVLVLNVTKEQMEGAKGFDEDNWPNFADANFTKQIDRRYGVDRTHTGDNRRRGNTDRTGRRNNNDRDDG